MGRSPKWSKDDCIKAVRAYEAHAAQIGQRPSIGRYWEWSKGREDRPSSDTLLNVFGSWNNARVASHGGEAVDLYVQHQRKWSEQIIFDALGRYEQYCRETNQHPSRDFYQEWQKQYSDTPSVYTVEQLGSWNEMRTKAASKNQQNIKVFAPRRQR